MWGFFVTAIGCVIGMFIATVLSNSPGAYQTCLDFEIALGVAAVFCIIAGASIARTTLKERLKKLPIKKPVSPSARTQKWTDHYDPNKYF